MRVCVIIITVFTGYNSNNNIVVDSGGDVIHDDVMTRCGSEGFFFFFSVSKSA